MRYDQAQKACRNNGMKLAHVTKTNLINVSDVVKSAAKDMAWVGSFEGKTPKKGGMLLNAGEPATIATVSSKSCRRAKHIAICEMGKQSVSASSSSSSDVSQTSMTGSSTAKKGALQVKKTMRRLQRRGYSYSGSSSSHTSERQYLRRLRKYMPPRHVNTGIKSIRLPEKRANARIGVSSRIPSSRKLVKSNRNNLRKVARRHTSSSSTSYTKAGHKKLQYSTRKPQHNKEKCHKKKCKKTGRSFLPLRSKSSSSSHSRSVSLHVFFSQEDAAILGSCDRPTIAFHHRHYCRHTCVSERSRSRSRTSGIF